MEIKDSGHRTEFASGAVRDIQEGKGRCDLLPLDVVATACNDWVISEVNDFVNSGDYAFLIEALTRYLSKSNFASWPDMLLEVAKHFEDGAKKYGERNWQKGIPVHCYIDSGLRHYFKWLRGDRDEPHDRALCWNLLCAIWTCMNKPKLNDYAKEGEENA